MKRPSFPSQLYAQLRMGRVDSVDADNHRVAVKFEEQDGMIVPDLQVLIPVGGDYALPKKDAPVACMLFDDRLGVGFVFGSFYTDADSPPLSDAGKRSVVSDDLRLGASDASDKVALAPATKDEIQKALDYADGIATAIKAGVAVAQDGGANLKATIVAALPTKPTINEPKAKNVSAK